MEREAWEGVNSVSLRSDRLRKGLKSMIESKREVLATKLEEQIARWGELLETAKINRSRCQN